MELPFPAFANRKQKSLNVNAEKSKPYVGLANVGFFNNGDFQSISSLHDGLVSV
ncbi:hypothetical protein [Thiomicrorhabdus immobilis]|uniref:hypothetical protein n=1 Tax=Thiomicrorhabdus immobilis TaxID=2791037 RepID=UPI001F1E7448|nr:hypothetical protein [Thiomicrorhabdus immobilis]